MLIKKHITQDDIAKKLHVSRITVSKALRDHPDISKAMKEKVLKCADKMGYTRNLIAANLSSKHTNTIGIVIPDLENSFFAYLTDTLIDSLASHGYSAILTVSREKEETEFENIKTLLGMRVDGLLVCTSQMTKGSGIFKAASKMGVPVIFFDRVIDEAGFSTVTFDDRKGTINALNNLIEMGFTRFAHFAGYANTSVGRERQSAFRYVMNKHGLLLKKDWIIEGGFELADGYASFKKLVSNNDFPQIILTVNDRVALGAFRAASELNIRIPDDISVAGYGFYETADMFNPRLAVINQNPRALGEEAVRMIVNEINGLKDIINSRVPVEFIINESVKIV